MKYYFLTVTHNCYKMRGILMPAQADDTDEEGFDGGLRVPRPVKEPIDIEL